MIKRILLVVMVTLALAIAATMCGCKSEISFADLPESQASVSTKNIDITDVENGTIKAHSASDVKSKVLLRNGENQQTYQLPEDGSEIVIPLNLGDGTYQVEICEHRYDTKYEVVGSLEFNVSDLGNKPYLSSNVICDFSQESGLAQHADYLCQSLTTDKEKMMAITSWVIENLTYDEAKSEELSDSHDYYPNAKEIYNTKTGICFDYASLTAAMLRSQGIPTKIMTGTYTPKGVYHSWNEVLIDGKWIDIDTTYAATSGSDLLIDRNLYEVRYVY